MVIIRCSIAHVLTVVALITVAGISCAAPETPVRPGRDRSAINPLHPIVAGRDTVMILLGGSRDGKWVKSSDIPHRRLSRKRGDALEAYEVDTPLLIGTEQFKVYSAKGLCGTAKVAGRPIWMVVPATGDTEITVKLSFQFKAEETETDRIGVNGDWDAAPRKLRRIDARTFGVDIDNDGVEEMIRRTDSTTTIEEEGEKLRVLVSQLAVIKAARTMPIYSFKQTPNYTQNYHWFLIDADGDGDLEVVTVDEGHNGEFMLHDFSKGAWRTVLSYYWGD